MPIEDYAAQPYNQQHEQFKYVDKICLSKSAKGYAGFSPVPTTTGSGKTSYLYFNNKDCNLWQSAIETKKSDVKHTKHYIINPFRGGHTP